MLFVWDGGGVDVYGKGGRGGRGMACVSKEISVSCNPGGMAVFVCSGNLKDNVAKR